MEVQTTLDVQSEPGNTPTQEPMTLLSNQRVTVEKETALEAALVYHGNTQAYTFVFVWIVIIIVTVIANLVKVRMDRKLMLKRKHETEIAFRVRNDRSRRSYSPMDVKVIDPIKELNDLKKKEAAKLHEKKEGTKIDSESSQDDQINMEMLNEDYL